MAGVLYLVSIHKGIDVAFLRLGLWVRQRLVRPESGWGSSMRLRDQDRLNGLLHRHDPAWVVGMYVGRILALETRKTRCAPAQCFHAQAMHLWTMGLRFTKLAVASWPCPRVGRVALRWGCCDSMPRSCRPRSVDVGSELRQRGSLNLVGSRRRLDVVAVGGCAGDTNRLFRRFRARGDHDAHVKGRWRASMKWMMVDVPCSTADL